MDDWSLLQEYVHRGSKEALDELVRRHLGMVYAAALRQIGEAHRAEDVTQVVFMVLMRRAGGISKRVVLGGWLFQVTVFTAAKMVRSEWRRREHERKAAGVREEVVEARVAGPEEGVAKLDEAIAGMPRIYRDAVVMRYLQGRSMREVAEAQRVSENTVRQRLFRGLAKLRRRLARGGVVESEEGIGAVLSAAGATAPGADVAGRIVGGLRASGASGASTLVVDAVVRSLIMVKLKTSLAAVVVVLLVVGIGGGTFYWAMGASSPTDSTNAATAAQGVKDHTPNAVLLDVFAAFRGGDVDSLVGAFEPMTGEQEASFRKIGQAMTAIVDLRAALNSRFGAGAADHFMAGISIDPSPDDVKAIERAQAVIDGDTARLDIPHMGLVHFVKAGGLWKLKADSLEGTFSQMRAAGPMLEDLAADIGDGKYATVQQVRDDFSKRLREVQNADPLPSPDRPVVLGPGKTPQETLAAFYWANISGDEDAAIACLQNPSPGQQRAMRLNTDLYSAGEKVRMAVAARFGQAAGRDAVLALGCDTGINRRLLETAPTTFAGDKAQVDLHKTIGITMNLTRTEGVWRIEPIGDMPDPPRPWGAMLRDHYLPLILQLASDVKGGKFVKIQQVQAAVDKLHQQLKADHDRLAGSDRA